MADGGPRFNCQCAGWQSCHFTWVTQQIQFILYMVYIQRQAQGRITAICRLPVTSPHGNFATVTSPHGNFATLSYIENLHCLHRNKTLNSRSPYKILSGFSSYLVTSPHKRNCGVRCGEKGVGECMG